MMRNTAVAMLTGRRFWLWFWAVSGVVNAVLLVVATVVKPCTLSSVISALLVGSSLALFCVTCGVLYVGLQQEG